MSEGLFTKGRFVWHDLMAKDPAKGKAFYTELMNWSAETMDMGPAGSYTMFKRNKTQGLAGVVSLDGAPPGVPSHWINYITVEDVDASCKVAEEAGGKVCVKGFDIPNVGRTAVIEDPTGAVFHFFRSKDGEPPEKERPEPGEFCWFEVFTTDVDKAKDFYGKVFGWTFEEMPQAEGSGSYWIAKRGGVPVAGLMDKPEMVPACAWQSYLLVENLEQASDRAVKLGAQKVHGPLEVKGYGRFTAFVDPSGAAFELFENAS